MIKRKKSLKSTIWGGRFEGVSSDNLIKFNSSIHFDKNLAVDFAKSYVLTRNINENRREYRGICMFVRGLFLNFFGVKKAFRLFYSVIAWNNSKKFHANVL